MSMINDKMQKSPMRLHDGMHICDNLAKWQVVGARAEKLCRV